mgnify:CR=1 FL=1
MNKNIWTSLLLLSPESGRLLSEWVCRIPENVLHDFYKTKETYGLTSEKDLIGQSVNLNFEQLQLVQHFIQKLCAEISRGNFELFTYWMTDNPEVLPSDTRLRLEAYEKNENAGHLICDIDLPSDMNLREVREVLRLPAKHNLVIDIPLYYEWQISYFKRYIHNLDEDRFHYVFSSWSEKYS